MQALPERATDSMPVDLVKNQGGNVSFSSNLGLWWHSDLGKSSTSGS